MSTARQCPACNQVFDSNTQMRQHFQDKHRAGTHIAFASEEKPDTLVVPGGVPVQRCGNCRYWGKGNNMTVCRKHPGTAVMMPGPTGAMVCVAMYTPVYDTEWCGEWEGGEPAGGTEKATTTPI